MTESAFNLEEIRAELTRLFGAPIKDADKMAAWRLEDGRELALDLKAQAAQLWVEANHPPPSELDSTPYAASESRHSNLPGRLNHLRPQAQPVALLRVRSWDQFRRLLDWYAAPARRLDRQRLASYKRAFLQTFPDFEPRGFAAAEGGYFSEEREYKDALIHAAQAAVRDFADGDEVGLGGRLLDLLTGRGGLPLALIDWRVERSIQLLRVAHPGVLEAAAGRLARTDDTTAGIVSFVETLWPILTDALKANAYSDTRIVPTVIAALVHPDGAFAFNTEPIRRTYRELTGERAFGENRLTADEYQRVFAFARELRSIMADEWDWAPRDLWDVQGFIWTVNRKGQPPVTVVQKTTNLILYGPPGTGKTYATAAEAVRLCSPGVDLKDRDAILAEYNRLVGRRQVEFVTFHQSYGYEQFVEGLRPQTGGEGQVGFRLDSEPGIFKLIAERAQTSKGDGASHGLGQRRVYKMSIGEAAKPEDDYLFEEALQDNFILLGWGNIDWSDRRFASRDEIIRAWREHEPDGPPATAMSGRVQSPDILRNWMKPGDVVVVTKGNKRFRAIGEVTGPYEFVAREDGGYPHRRAVRWLWSNPDGVPVEEIYAKKIIQKTLYELTPRDLNVPALERYMASGEPAGASKEQFVLIIDEINRANISKVFGELITLIEPDKRLGAEGELKVRLPYSGEEFGVPANLHIIGTMNSADRSIALIDTALRRRFEFKEYMPNPGLLTDCSKRTEIDVVTFLTTMNDAIEYLFDREHQIGHAYFMGCQTAQDVREILRHKVIPLLAEYFYDDLSKVAAVLGDANGGGRFIERLELKPPVGVEVEEGAEPRYRWRVKERFNL